MDADKALRLVIVRHGTTASNLKGLMAGSMDFGLTEEAKADIAAMVAGHPYPPVDMLFRSPLRRTLETMQIVYPGQEATVLPGLHEVYFGDDEGRELPLVLDRPDRSAFFSRDAEFRFPGGESFGEADKRITATIGDIIAAAQEQGARSAGIVSHGMIMDVFLQKHIMPKLSPEQLFIPNGFGIALSVDMQLWNDSNMLAFAGLLPEGLERPPLSSSPFAKMYED